MSFVRESYKDRGLKDETIELLMNSWRKKTKLQYNVYLKRWFEFSRESIENPLRPTLHDGMEFLTYLFSQGYSHGQISRARSAISVLIDKVNDISFGRHPLVKRLMKGIFEARPIFPKYRTVWSVNIVFNYFRTLDHPKNLSMGLLGKKLALLMCLIAGGQRCQTLHAIDIRDIKFVEDKCVIPIYEKLKQTKPGVHMKPMEFKLFTSDPKLCVINNLKVYLDKTESVRKDTQLFISYYKPNRSVSKDTIGRWCKYIMKLAGIDVEHYCVHSSRSAASSFAKSKGVSLKDIAVSAGWKSERTFCLHYDRNIEEFNIGHHMLQS